MLQSIRDRLTGWVALAILGTIAVTFVFVGGASFVSTGNNFAAKVDGVEISVGQFESAYQQRIQNNPQIAALPQNIRASLRNNILEQLIQQRVIDNYLDDAGYRVSDTEVTDLIQAQTEFQVDGKFDRETYRSVLSAENYTPAQFEASQRLAMRRNQLQRAIRGSSVVAPTDYRRFLNLAYEKRVVTSASITAESVAAEINVTDELIAAYYDENPGLYQIPESADVAYVEVSRTSVVANVSVTEEQVQQYYDVSKDRFLQDEERKARHILILFDGDEAGAEIVATEILTRARGGELFADLAKQYSQDGGTATLGGDLGAVSKTQLSAELGDAVFAMQEGEVNGLVKSDFGFHIVRLDEIVARGPLPYEQVQASLRLELQEQEADGLVLALRNQLSYALFAAADIDVLASEVGVPVQNAAGFTRSSNEPFANNQRAADAVFDAAVLSGERLSDVIELDADRTVVLAVIEHYPATRRSLDDVREMITTTIRNNQSETLMAARAQQMLSALQTGVEFDLAAESVGAVAASPMIMTRDARDADQFIAVAVFTAPKPTTEKPSTGSTRNGVGGYTVYRLDAVVPGRPEAIPLADRDAGRDQLVDKYGVGDFIGFVQALRANADIVTNNDVLAVDDLL